MSVISSMILLWWCYTIIRRHDFVVSLALVAKVSAGFVLGLLYKFYLGGGDTFQYFHEGKTIALYFIDHPNQIFPIYFRTLHLIGYHQLILLIIVDPAKIVKNF